MSPIQPVSATAKITNPTKVMMKELISPQKKKVVARASVAGQTVGFGRCGGGVGDDEGSIALSVMRRDGDISRFGGSVPVKKERENACHINKAGRHPHEQAAEALVIGRT